jgi:hypothetical protein
MNTAAAFSRGEGNPHSHRAPSLNT